MKKLNVYFTCISLVISSIPSFAYDTNVGGGAYQNVVSNVQGQNVQNATQNANQNNNPNTFDPNNNQHVNLNQEIANSKTRTDTENEQYRNQQAQQQEQQMDKAGGYANGASNSAKQAGVAATNNYNNSSLNATNENGSAYQQADDGQKKADSGAMIGKVVGGAMVVAGGVAIAIGTGLMGTIWGIPKGTATTAVGAILVGMGGMELAQGELDADASRQAGSSKYQLGGYDPNQRYSYDPKNPGYNKNPYTYTDPTGNNNSQGNNNNTTNTNSTAKNGDGTQNKNTGEGSGGQTIIPGSDSETKMSNEFAKYGIGYDKKTQTVTLPDGRQFTIQDIQKGKMPDSELQAAYNKAKSMGGDIASRELSGSGFGSGLAGSSGPGNGSLGFGNKNDSNLSKVAGALKSGLGADGAGADGVGGRGLASEDGAGGDGGVGGAGLRGKSAKSAAEQAAAAKALAAKVAGLSTNYNGEPIGVASDSIFEMIKRRYEMKDKENSFINDLLNVTSN